MSEHIDRHLSRMASYYKMDDEKSENAKNSENCPSEIFTSQICGYDDQTHVCMSGTRKHMSDTCFQQSDGCILTQVIARGTTKKLRMRKTVKTVLLKFSRVKYVVDQTHVC